MLNGKFISPPLLPLPRSQGTYLVNIDAFERQIGSILHQKQSNEHYKLIGYWSRSLTDAELPYDTTCRDCLVIV